jgi:putative flippase GtrA
LRKPTKTTLREADPARELLKGQEGGILESLRKAGASLRYGIVTSHDRRLVRFCLVGASGAVVNTALLYLLAEGGGLSPLVAAVFSTEAAILNNFLFNDLWTFADARSSTSWYWRALRYNSVALVGLVISLAVLAGLTHVLSLHYLTANLFAIGAGTLWNYTGSSYLTWAMFNTSIPTDGTAGEPSRRGQRFVSLLLAKVTKPWT